MKRKIYRDILDAGLLLARHDIVDEQDLATSFGAYVRTAHEALLENSENAKPIYDQLKHLYETIDDICDGSTDIESDIVALWRDLSKLAQNRDTETRIAGMNALADLRDLYPNDRKLRRRAARVGRDTFINRAWSDSFESFHEGEYDASQRLRRGTMWDIEGYVGFMTTHYRVKDMQDQLLDQVKSSIRL